MHSSVARPDLKLAMACVMACGCSSNTAAVDAHPSDTRVDTVTTDAPAAARNRVFITSTRWTGDLKSAGGGSTGLAGADNLCAMAATQGALGGVWTAWLSTQAVNAIDRIADVGPWYLVDKTTLVFQNRADIPAFPLAPVSVDELGQSPTGDAVWTGTLSAGTVATSNCVDWTNSSSSVNGIVGAWVFGGDQWTAAAQSTCDTVSNLYCFER